MTPTARSLAHLRKHGYSVAVVEKWIPATPAGFKGPIKRSDVWQFGDLLAAKVGEPGATLIQTTSGTNVSARVNKIKGIAESGIWLAAGNKIVVHGWSKKGPRGKAKRWTPRVVEILTGGITREVENV